MGGVFNNQPKTFIEKYEDEVTLNRMADKEDLLGAIILLSSDMSNYITGQSIVVDGGWVLGKIINYLTNELCIYL